VCASLHGRVCWCTCANFAHQHSFSLQVRDFVDAAYKRTVALVEEKKDLILAMSQELLNKEVSDSVVYVRVYVCVLEYMRVHVRACLHSSTGNCTRTYDP